MPLALSLEYQQSCVTSSSSYSFLATAILSISIDYKENQVRGRSTGDTWREKYSGEEYFSQISWLLLVMGLMTSSKDIGNVKEVVAEMGRSLR